MWANVYAGEHYIKIRPYPWAGLRPPCVLWGPFSCRHAPGHSTILSECDSEIFCPAGIYPKTWKKGSAIVFSHLFSDVDIFECKVSWGVVWHLQSSYHRGACVCLLFLFFKQMFCVCAQWTSASDSCDPMKCSPPDFSVHGISQQEYWSGLPFPPPGDLPTRRSNQSTLPPVTKN